MPKIMNVFKQKKEFVILAIIVLLSVLITLVNPVFLTFNNIVDFIRSNAVYGIMAFGMLPVLVTGGIDLSVSSTIALCAVVAGKFMQANPGTNVFVVILLSMLVGALVGAINGFLITKIKIPPIVATIGVQTITLAAVLLYSGGIWISGLPEWFSKFGSFKLGNVQSGGNATGIYSQIWILLLAGIVTWFILRNTLIGRGIYAVGGNLQSALRVGYKPDRILMFVYMFCGAMTGLSAVVHISIVGQVDPNTYLNYEMDVIAIIVLGGASLAGGIGTVFGTTLGIILMAVIKNGLVLVRVSTYYQKVVMGVIIVLTIVVDAINTRIAEKNACKVDVED
ncbi:MAG: ABC transporter permease [Lachnospiraceae bacterium]|nr:ABC transporter permease [Lachnospiraceae bacterium]